jgi:small subunit ribosomal protein S2
MSSLPGALFVVDINREAIAVAEANRLKIPVVAIVDTNCDPDPIDYPIPGNDDAIRAISLVCTVIGDTVAKAQQEYAKVVAEAEKRRENERAAQEAKTKAARARKEAEEQAAAPAEKPAVRTHRAKAKAAAEAAASAPTAAAETTETPAPQA